MTTDSTSAPAPGSSPLLLEAVVSVAQEDGQPPETPEPSGLALSGSALLMRGLSRRLLRRE